MLYGWWKSPNTGGGQDDTTTRTDINHTTLGNAIDFGGDLTSPGRIKIVLMDQVLKYSVMDLGQSSTQNNFIQFAKLNLVVILKILVI